MGPGSHQCAKLCVYNDVTAVHDLQERLCSDALLLWRGRARYPLLCPCRRIIVKVARQDTLWSWSWRGGCNLICEWLQLLFGRFVQEIGFADKRGESVSAAVPQHQGPRDTQLSASIGGSRRERVKHGAASRLRES